MAITLDLRAFKALTFDCYGTLIDWETGILTAMRPVLSAHDIALNDDKILEAYAEFESKTQKETYLPYREVLRIVMQQFGRRGGFTPTAAELDALPDSLPNWLPFSDTVPALQTLAQRYSLNILSNIDDDLFTASAQRLAVSFDNVITAMQVKSYKPSNRNFEEMLRRIGLPREEILHVAQSLYHDIVPAKALGLATVWVNRRKGQASSGATLPATARPDWEVPDLQTLAHLVAYEPR